MKENGSVELKWYDCEDLVVGVGIGRIRPGSVQKAQSYMKPRREYTDPFPTIKSNGLFGCG
jgi:hypothetical protein